MKQKAAVDTYHEIEIFTASKEEKKIWFKQLPRLFRLSEYIYT